MAKRRAGQVIVGFAAETGDLIANGTAKLAAKGCDLLVINQVGDGLAFGTADNAAEILAADGQRTSVPRGPKEQLADVIWDLVAGRLGLTGRQPGIASDNTGTPLNFGEVNFEEGCPRGSSPVHF